MPPTNMQPDGQSVTNANDNIANPGQVNAMYSPHVDNTIPQQHQPSGFAIDAEDGAYANPPINENPPPPAAPQVQSPYPPEPQIVEPSVHGDVLPLQSPPDVVPSVSAHFMPPEDPSGVMNPQLHQQQQQQQINSSQPEVLQQIPSNLQNFGQPPTHQQQHQEPEIVSQAAGVDDPPQPQQAPSGQQQFFDQQQQQDISIPGILPVQQHQLSPSLSQDLNFGQTPQVQQPQQHQQPQPNGFEQSQTPNQPPQVTQQHIPVVSSPNDSINQQPTGFIPQQQTVEKPLPNQQQHHVPGFMHQQQQQQQLVSAPFQPVATSPLVPMQAPLPQVQQPGFHQAVPTSSAGVFAPLQEIPQQQQKHNTLSPQASNSSVNTVISTDGGYHMQQPNLPVIGQQQPINQQLPSGVNAPPLAVTAASVEADDPETQEETSAINELFGRSAPKPKQVKQSPPPSFDQQLVAALESHQQQQTSSGNPSLSLSPGNSIQPSAENHLLPAQCPQSVTLNQSLSGPPANNSYQEIVQTNANVAPANFPQQQQQQQMAQSQQQGLAAPPQQSTFPQQQQQQAISPSPQPMLAQQQQQYIM